MIGEEFTPTPEDVREPLPTENQSLKHMYASSLLLIRVRLKSVLHNQAESVE